MAAGGGWGCQNKALQGSTAAILTRSHDRVQTDLAAMTLAATSLRDASLNVSQEQELLAGCPSHPRF